MLELRSEFLRESRLKLASVADLVDRLAAEPRDDNALHELHRRFHGFAGSGTSYGFPEVSRLGRDAERSCLKLVQAGSLPSAAQIEAWRTAEEDLRAQFESVSGAPRLVEHPAHKPVPLQALIVDDDAQTRRICRRILEVEGMVVREAGDQAEASALIAAQLPDVMLVDVLLPEGSGYDLVEEVRRRPDGEALAVLMISVRKEFNDRVRGVTCGADGYFEKPIDWEALLRRLHHVLERCRALPGRVLSVDDDPAEAAFLRTVLESGGYEFRSCTTPERFEAVLTSFKPDLVLWTSTCRAARATISCA